MLNSYSIELTKIALSVKTMASALGKNLARGRAMEDLIDGGIVEQAQHLSGYRPKLTKLLKQKLVSSNKTQIGENPDLITNSMNVGKRVNDAFNLEANRLGPEIKHINQEAEKLYWSKVNEGLMGADRDKIKKELESQVLKNNKLQQMIDENNSEISKLHNSHTDSILKNTRLVKELNNIHVHHNNLKTDFYKNKTKLIDEESKNSILQNSIKSLKKSNKDLKIALPFGIGGGLLAGYYGNKYLKSDIVKN